MPFFLAICIIWEFLVCVSFEAKFMGFNAEHSRSIHFQPLSRILNEFGSMPGKSCTKSTNPTYLFGRGFHEGVARNVSKFYFSSFPIPSNNVVDCQF